MSSVRSDPLRYQRLLLDAFERGQLITAILMPRGLYQCADHLCIWVFSQLGWL